MNSGIYTISCIVTGHFYIGRTSNFKRRIVSHLFRLRHNDHYSKKLQELYNLYGEESIKFDLIVQIDENDIEAQIIAEQKQLDIFVGSEKCLNLGEHARVGYNGELPIGNMKRTDEQCRHISKGLIGHVLSDETKRKISESHKGKKLKPETIQKLSDHFSGEGNPMFGRTGKNHPFSIPIWQVDPNTQEKIRHFESAVDAAKEFGAKDGSNLRKALRKGIKAYGFLWVEDESQQTIESTEQSVNE